MVAGHLLYEFCQKLDEVSTLLMQCHVTLRWRHNGRDRVSHHQPHDCLLNHLFRHRSKKTSKLRVTGLCAGNSPGPVNGQLRGKCFHLMTSSWTHDFQACAPHYVYKTEHLNASLPIGVCYLYRRGQEVQTMTPVKKVRVLNEYIKCPLRAKRYFRGQCCISQSVSLLDPFNDANDLQNIKIRVISYLRKEFLPWILSLHKLCTFCRTLDLVLWFDQRTILGATDGEQNHNIFIVLDSYIPQLFVIQKSGFSWLQRQRSVGLCHLVTKT